MSRKLVPDEQRAIVIAALQYRSNKSEIARRYGISRARIYQLLNHALTDPRGKLREAEREVEFRRRVLELTRWRQPPYT
jgi:transposase-like protein